MNKSILEDAQDFKKAIKKCEDLFKEVIKEFENAMKEPEIEKGTICYFWDNDKSNRTIGFFGGVDSGLYLRNTTENVNSGRYYKNVEPIEQSKLGIWVSVDDDNECINFSEQKMEKNSDGRFVCRSHSTLNDRDDEWNKIKQKIGPGNQIQI